MQYQREYCGYSLVEAPAKVEAANCLRYSLPQTLTAEGSHNGSAAVLKTADRKVMQVRVLSPPPFLFNDLPLVIRSHSFGPGSQLARFWRASGAPGHQTQRQR